MWKSLPYKYVFINLDRMAPNHRDYVPTLQLTMLRNNGRS